MAALITHSLIQSINVTDCSVPGPVLSDAEIQMSQTQGLNLPGAPILFPPWEKGAGMDGFQQHGQVWQRFKHCGCKQVKGSNPPQGDPSKTNPIATKI